MELEGHERCFKVSYVNTFDEPVGGLMNVLLTEDGQHHQRIAGGALSWDANLLTGGARWP